MTSDFWEAFYDIPDMNLNQSCLKLHCLLVFVPVKRAPIKGKSFKTRIAVLIRNGAFFLQVLPECSALNAETLHQVPAWVPDTPASRADLSALYTTLSRLDQVRLSWQARVVSESRQKCFLRQPLLDKNYLAYGNIYRASASSYASWKPLLSSRTR